MNYLDLFSGIGGFALGAYWAGLRFERHYFSEIDPWCCALYQRRFPDAVPLGDIREIDGRRLVADYDRDNRGTPRASEAQEGAADMPFDGNSFIITGGFPCQDISVAGKGAGIEGVRSGLWFEYARIIGEIRPRYAIMENVGALTRRGLDRVLGSLAEIGYDAQWSDIRASDVGAPHRRERIWIVCWDANRERENQINGVLERAHAYGSRDGRAVADSTINGRDARRESDAEKIQGGRESHRGGERAYISNTSGARLEGQREVTGGAGSQLDDACHHSGWSVEPDVGRVAHGVPQRVDRLRGLGNAIVPQIAEMIFRELAL